MRRYEVGTEGTLDLGTASSATVTCTITGSFTSAPVIYTNCEGNFTSTASAVTGSGNTYTATITVRPTTAYAGDNMSGKLTVYCPYYGNTGIGQINLAATGSGELVLQSTSTEPMTILEKPANNATASITFRLEGEDAPPSSGLPVIIDNNYTLTDVQNVLTNDGTKDVETGNGFSASLDYAGTEGWITLGDCNYDAATKKFTQHFTLDDNTSTESPRTGAVVVFSPSRREVARFIIKQEPATPPTIIDATNLAVGQSANCYIISKPGRYELPAYKGVYKDLTTAPKCTGKPYEVWNDSGNTINFLQANFSDNKIIFDVNSVNNGNALIAVRDKNNKILWSWHLWFCSEVPGDQDYGNNVYLMDRALGAKESTSIDLGSLGGSTALYWKEGLYYQWGRKDPLNTKITSGDNKYDSQTTSRQESSIEKPNTFYTNWSSGNGWSSSFKGVQDPCPAGYKVPSPNVWIKQQGNSIGQINRASALDQVFVYAISNPTIAYPYSGFINEEGEWVAGATGGRQTPTYTDEIKYEYKFVNAGYLPDRVDPPMKFKDIEYISVNIDNIGALWGLDKTALEYGFVEKGITILKYSYTVGQWTGRIWKTASYPNGWTTNVSIQDRPLDSDLLTQLSTMINMGGFSLEDLLSGKINESLIYRKEQKSANMGYNVRCVKE